MTSARFSLRQLAALLRSQSFRQLFAVRLSSQLADGMFQVALASHVLFSPERETSAADIAGGLAVLLLPFTLLGPFVGVFLDRWPRRQVLALSNGLRVVLVLVIAALVAADVPDPALYVGALLCLSVNRFVLAGLSASLPHVVSPEDLVTANALTPTFGSVAALAGAGVGSAAAVLGSDAAALIAAAGTYAVATALALLIPRRALGPDTDRKAPGLLEGVRSVVAGLRDGLRHLGEHRGARAGLLAISATRFLYGLTTVIAVLLYRSYFNSADESSQALADTAVFIAVSGAGFLVAALLTPPVVSRVGTRAWLITLLAVAAVVTAYPFSTFDRTGLLVAGGLLGLAVQGIKICVDTQVQLDTYDEFRGRVFSLYDVLFNLAFLLAACVALLLPDDGSSRAVVLATAAGYVLTAVLFARSSSEPERAFAPGRDPTEGER